MPALLRTLAALDDAWFAVLLAGLAAVGLVWTLSRLTTRWRGPSPRGPAGLLERGGLQFDGLAALAFFAACFAIAATLPMQNDSWWQLRAGQLIWDRGAVVREDPFSFALAPGTPWPNHEWLAQALFYPTWSLGGPRLATLGAGLLALGAVAVVWSFMEARPALRAALAALMLPLLKMGWSMRPQLFTALMLAVSLRLVVKRRELLLVPLFLVWANLHGGVALGGLLLLVATVWAALWDRPRLPRLAAVTAACGAACAVTPLGLGIYAFPLESVARLRAAAVEEWGAPSLDSLSGQYFFFAVALLVAALVADGEGCARRKIASSCWWRSPSCRSPWR